MRKTPYHRIMDNAKNGLGVVLSADEVWHMSHDDAIRMVGELDQWDWEEARRQQRKRRKNS